jgi:hypothetical protein
MLANHATATMKPMAYVLAFRKASRFFCSFVRLAGGREDAGAVLAVPEVDSDGDVVRGHKAES